MKRSRAVMLFVVVALVTLFAWPVLAQAETTDLVSQSSDGTPGDSGSGEPSISDDGSCVAFSSTSTNLVPDDLNGAIMDVFVRNLLAGKTELVSVAYDGGPANGESGSAALNADGTIVTFTSSATNLVEGIDWGDVSYQNVFVRNLFTGKTELVSISNDGTEAANGYCMNPSISADGTVIAFDSQATNLVASADANADGPDVFVRDTEAQTTELVSINSGGEQSDGWSGDSCISADGNVVGFVSEATNLAAADTDGGNADIFVRDRKQATTELVSVTAGGVTSESDNFEPSVNADGTVVAFVSVTVPEAPDGGIIITGVDVLPGGFIGPQVYVRDRSNGVTEQVGAVKAGTDYWTFMPSVNADGSLIAFVAEKADQIILASDSLSSAPTMPVSNIFVWDREAQTTKLISVGPDGSSSNGWCETPSISANGSLVAFMSLATNLFPGDSNDDADVFVSTYTRKLKSGYPIRHEETDSKIVFTGEWSEELNESYSAGSLKLSSDQEASITITFKGTRLDWIAAIGPLMGKALVSIDGGEPVLVDLFSPIDLFQQLVWSTGDLEYGIHVITITFPEGQEEVKPINVDAFDVWGTLLATTEE